MDKLNASVPVSLPRTRRARRLSGTEGFSLTEMAFVMAIGVAIASYGVVQTQAAMRIYRVQESSAALSAKVAEARMNALKRNRSVWVQIDQEAGTMQVQMTDPADPTGDPMNIGPQVRLSRGVAFAGAVPAQVVFDALGRLTATQAIALQDNSGNARTLSVSLSGAVTTAVGLMSTASPGGDTGGTTTGGTGTTVGTTTVRTGTTIPVGGETGVYTTPGGASGGTGAQ